MSTVFYVAVATGDQVAGYRAAFPDLPGCSASGADLGELITRARDAVRVELQRLADDGQGWPKPTPIEQISAAPPAAVLLVDVQVEDTPVRVNISIGEQLLRRLDAAAEERGTTRSGFIAQAVRASLGEKSSGAGYDFDLSAKRLQEELSAFGRKISDNLGPESAFSRTMADLDDRLTETVRKAADSVSAAMARRRATEPGTEKETDPPRAETTEH